MNKIAIQAILFSVIGISMIYALMPVDSASTSHMSVEVKGDAIDASKIKDDAINSDGIATDAIGAEEIADNAIDAGALATDAIGAEELATSAVQEIGSLDRSFSWHLKSANNPIQNMVLIPELPGKGSIILTQLSGAGAQNRCIIETGDGQQILNGGNKDSSTSSNLSSYVGEQIQIDMDAEMECAITVYLTDNSGNP